MAKSAPAFEMSPIPPETKGPGTAKLVKGRKRRANARKMRMKGNLRTSVFGDGIENLSKTPSLPLALRIREGGFYEVSATVAVFPIRKRAFVGRRGIFGKKRPPNGAGNGIFGISREHGFHPNVFFGRYGRVLRKPLRGFDETGTFRHQSRGRTLRTFGRGFRNAGEYAERRYVVLTRHYGAMRVRNGRKHPVRHSGTPVTVFGETVGGTIGNLPVGRGDFRKIRREGFPFAVRADFIGRPDFRKTAAEIRMGEFEKTEDGIGMDFDLFHFRQIQGFGKRLCESFGRPFPFAFEQADQRGDVGEFPARGGIQDGVCPDSKRKLWKIPVCGERARDDEDHGSDYGDGFSHIGIVSIFPDYGEGKSCAIGMPL
ncbi:MAG: hypothetical protein QG650_701 [Patescibacteria group bacterium]|nr:hypothetical protein [Patescibacteria group bacterium]